MFRLTEDELASLDGFLPSTTPSLNSEYDVQNICVSCSTYCTQCGGGCGGGCADYCGNNCSGTGR